MVTHHPAMCRDYRHCGSGNMFSVCQVNVTLSLFTIGFLGASHRWREEAKKDPLPKICHTSHNEETWYSYILPKKDPKNI